jgi:hypothetical protein
MEKGKNEGVSISGKVVGAHHCMGSKWCKGLAGIQGKGRGCAMSAKCISISGEKNDP